MNKENANGIREHSSNITVTGETILCPIKTSNSILTKNQLVPLPSTWKSSDKQSNGKLKFYELSDTRVTKTFVP